MKYRFAILCILAAIPLFGLAPREPATLATVTFVAGSTEIRDTIGRIVDPLAFRNTVLLSSDTAASEEPCLVAPQGTGSLVCVLVEGYLVCAEGQEWTSPSYGVSRETEQTDGVSVVASGYITGSITAYKCMDQHEPDNEEKPRMVSVLDPTRYVLHRREYRLRL